MDSASGRQLFKFDRSLMERLSDAGMRMSQINVQRRMRPSISHIIRYRAVSRLTLEVEILYVLLGQFYIPSLRITILSVTTSPYKAWRRMSCFSHDNAENAEAESASRYNMFEVRQYSKLPATHRPMIPVTAGIPHRSQSRIKRSNIFIFPQQGLYQQSWGFYGALGP
jgi:hypothetical protein